MIKMMVPSQMTDTQWLNTAQCNLSSKELDKVSTAITAATRESTEARALTAFGGSMSP